MQIVDEIPLLLMSIYLFRWFDSWPFGHLFLDLHPLCEGHRRERPSLVGSLAGAAHLLNDNTGVLRGAQ